MILLQNIIVKEKFYWQIHDILLVSKRDIFYTQGHCQQGQLATRDHVIEKDKLKI